MEDIKVGKITLSKTTFESLVKHLVEVEEGKNKLFQEYFPVPSKERNEMEMLIEDYIKQIDQLVKNTVKTQTTENQVPLVTIGCEVEIQDLSNQEVFKYHIVSPFPGSMKMGDISYLSPVGKTLLLKKVGDKVEVKAPGGIFCYKVKSIQFRGDII